MSCIFQSVADQRVKGNSLLAINKAGVHFLHPKSHVSGVPIAFYVPLDFGDNFPYGR